MLFEGMKGQTNGGKLVDFTATIAPSAEQKFAGRLTSDTVGARFKTTWTFGAFTRDQLAVA